MRRTGQDIVASAPYFRGHRRSQAGLGGSTMPRNHPEAASGLPSASKSREKVFGLGRPRALDRNAKVRVMHWARWLSRRTEKGRAYGVWPTAKALAVLEALLWGFHNAKSGLCFPVHETIAEFVVEIVSPPAAANTGGVRNCDGGISPDERTSDKLAGRIGLRIEILRVRQQGAPLQMPRSRPRRQAVRLRPRGRGLKSDATLGRDDGGEYSGERGERAGGTFVHPRRRDALRLRTSLGICPRIDVRAGEIDVDAGDAAALAALDLVVCLAVSGRAPLQVVLDTIAAATPVREALVRDANRRNERPPPLSAARLDPLVDSCRLN